MMAAYLPSPSSLFICNGLAGRIFKRVNEVSYATDFPHTNHFDAIMAGRALRGDQC